jgi:membrane protein
MAPLSVLLVWVGSVAWETVTLRAEIVRRLTESIGPDAARIVESALTDAVMPTSEALFPAALAFIMFAFSATAVLSQLQGALRDVWGVQAAEQSPIIRSFLRRRLIALAVIGALGLVLAVSMLSTVVLATLASIVPSTGPGPVATVIDRLASIVSLTLMFTVVLKILPDADVSWREACLGGTLTAGLHVVGQWLAGYLIASNGTASAYGAAGAIVVFLFWVYYSAIVFLLGAELTHVLWTSTNDDQR